MEAYLHSDGRSLKLGKQPPKEGVKKLHLANYLAADIPDPAPSNNWFGSVTDWGMMGNDQLGDCTCAAFYHGVQVASLNNSNIGIVTAPDGTVIDLYSKACGYVPGNSATDQGGVITDVLGYMGTNGLWTPQTPYELFAWADVDFTNQTHVKLAIQFLGVLDIGIVLPISAQSQVGSEWDVVGNPTTDANSQPGSWGGHSVVVCAYDANGLTCITWGKLQKMTWNFWNTYVDEAHALLFRAWSQRTASGTPQVQIAQWQADMQALVN